MKQRVGNCPECGGSGSVALFTSVSRCVKCGGSGWVNSHLPAAYEERLEAAVNAGKWTAERTGEVTGIEVANVQDFSEFGDF